MSHFNVATLEKTSKGKRQFLDVNLSKLFKFFGAIFRKLSCVTFSFALHKISNTHSQALVFAASKTQTFYNFS